MVSWYVISNSISSPMKSGKCSWSFCLWDRHKKTMKKWTQRSNESTRMVLIMCLVHPNSNIYSVSTSWQNFFSDSWFAFLNIQLTVFEQQNPSWSNISSFCVQTQSESAQLWCPLLLFFQLRLCREKTGDKKIDVDSPCYPAAFSLQRICFFLSKIFSPSV